MVFKIRLPRVVLGLLVGGALALGGVVFQGIFHNPLVEPFTLGVSGGAALGISIYTCLGVTSSVGLPLAGFLGALVAVLIVYVISGLGLGPTSLGLLLVGIMF